MRCVLGAENTSNGSCDTSLHKATSQEEHVFGATVAAGLMADTDLDVGSQQVSCGTAASASSRPSFAGNRADGRPSLCSSECAGGFRGAGGPGALYEESVGGADVHDQARVGSRSGTKGGKPCVKARIQDGVFVNSSGVSCHACVSYLDALLAAPARAPGASTAARRFAPSSAVVGLGMHDDGSPVHDACSNSWSDTVRVQGPTGTRSSKGGVSGPAEDLRPVSEVEAGVNFRPAGGARGAGCRFTSQEATRHRFQASQGGGAVTPSLHPEVPGIQLVPPGYRLDIRQSMGWTKVCGTTRSGILVLKGNARACMFPANLDHLRVEWMKRGAYKTAWVTPGRDCLCSYKYGHGAAGRPQTNDASLMGFLVCGAGSHPSYHLGVVRRMCQQG